MRLLRMGERRAARRGRASALRPCAHPPLSRAPNLEVRNAVGAGRAELRDLEGLTLGDHLLDQIGKKKHRRVDLIDLVDRVDRVYLRNRAEHRFPPSYDSGSSAIRDSLAPWVTPSRRVSQIRVRVANLPTAVLTSSH